MKWYTMYIHGYTMYILGGYTMYSVQASGTFTWRQYRRFVLDISICWYLHHETSISMFWCMTSISGMICNFNIKASDINIVVSKLRYWRTQILKSHRYRRFVPQYRRIPIWKKLQYWCFYFNIDSLLLSSGSIYGYRRFALWYRRFNWFVWALLVHWQGSRQQLHWQAAVLYWLLIPVRVVLLPACPREGRAAARAAPRGPGGQHRPCRARRGRARHLTAGLGGGGRIDESPAHCCGGACCSGAGGGTSGISWITVLLCRSSSSIKVALCWRILFSRWIEDGLSLLLRETRRVVCQWWNW